jgi:hypothetical protein
LPKKIGKMMKNQLKLDLPSHVSEPFGASLLLTGRSTTVKLPGIVLDGFGSALGMMIIAQIEKRGRWARFFGAEVRPKPEDLDMLLEISQMDVYPPVN